MTTPRFLLLAMIGVCCALPPAYATEYVVDGANPAANDANPGTAAKPLRTIQKAADLTQPGDTVTVKAGTYRETVILRHSGTATAPISFRTEQPGSVCITGADVIAGWQRVPGDVPVYRVPWTHQFIINHTPDGKPIEHHPADAPVWGRAEQVIVDGKQLTPTADVASMSAEWTKLHAAPPAQKAVSPWGPGIPDSKDSRTWTGMFTVDTTNKWLFVCLADGSDPNTHTVEAATRGLVFGTNPWLNKTGVAYVHVTGFTFRYGATFPQRAGVWLYGHDNVLSNCFIDQMAGSGVSVSGTMKQCVIRSCGQTGGGGRGDGFLNESCLWEGNCWKPINRGWDAGGDKLTDVDGGVFRDCVFYRNGGPGLWFDIDVRNVTVTHCAFVENEGSGLFIEISRYITVTQNLCVGNGIGVVGDVKGLRGWSTGGIQLGESMHCTVTQNTCVGNKDGITLREQGPRLVHDIPFHNQQHTITGNICADNLGYQLGLWYDNGFFGWHPADRKKYKTEAAYEAFLKANPDRVYDPSQQKMVIDHNLYYAGKGESLILYGCPWRPKSRTFAALPEFAKVSGMDAHSVVADPVLQGRSAGDYRLAATIPATTPRAGWLNLAESIPAWIKRLKGYVSPAPQT